MKHQTVTTWRAGRVERLELPPAGENIMPGVRWGRFDEFFTPAFWVARAWVDGESSVMVDYGIGRSLREEVAACLLGGHGMPAEVGLAAFQRVRAMGLLDGQAPQGEIEAALTRPLVVSTRQVRYRYPRTKSRFLALAMQRLSAEAPPDGSAVELRNWLVTFPGIGPKTASWITRNVLHSDEVAILDIHILRAGLLMKVFSPSHSIPGDYLEMERRLVAFARAVGVSLAKFDSMVWCYMRQFNAMALAALAAMGAKGGLGRSGLTVGS